MSTAANHRKRSHRSEAKKAAAYSASARRMFYRTARDNQNRGFFARFKGAFRRSGERQAVRSTETGAAE